jgi:tetratricopeptide (TPR) repeat protein
MKPWVRFGILFCAVSFVRAEQDSTDARRAQDLEHQGVYAFTEGDYEKALSLFNEEIALRRSISAPYLWRGLCLQELNRHLDAVMSFNRVLDTDSTNSLAQFYRARSYRALRMYDLAVESFSAARRHRPEFLPPSLELGLLHTERKNYDAAIATLEGVARRNPGHVPAYTYLAQAYMLKGIKDSAERCYVRSCELDSTNYSSFVGLGGFYYQCHRYAEGISSFKRAAWIDPLSSEAYRKLGDGYSKVQDYGGAVQTYGRALQLGDSSVQVLSGIGSAFFSLQATDSALFYFRQAASKDTSEPLVHFNLGVALSQKRQLRDAIAEFQKALELSRTEFFSSTLVQLGANQYKLHEYKKARESYQKALVFTDEYPPALYNLAVLYDVGLKDPKQALRYYKQFLRASRVDQSQEDLRRQARQQLKRLGERTRKD